MNVPAFRRVLKRKSKRKKAAAPSEAKGSEGWPLILGSDLIYAATPPEVGAALAGAVRTALARSPGAAAWLALETREDSRQERCGSQVSALSQAAKSAAACLPKHLLEHIVLPRAALKSSSGVNTRQSRARSALRLTSAGRGLSQGAFPQLAAGG